MIKVKTYTFCIVGFIACISLHACNKKMMKDDCEIYTAWLDMEMEYDDGGFSNFGEFQFDVDLDGDEVADIQFFGQEQYPPVDAFSWSNGIMILDDRFELFIETAWDTLCLDTTIYNDNGYDLLFFDVVDCAPGEYSNITEYIRPVLFDEADLSSSINSESSNETQVIHFGNYEYDNSYGTFTGTIYRGIEWSGPREAFIIFKKTIGDLTEQFAIKISGNHSSCKFLTVEEVRQLNCL